MVKPEDIRAILEKMNADGELVVCQIMEDRGLEIEEYVELISDVIETLAGRAALANGDEGK